MENYQKGISVFPINTTIFVGEFPMSHHESPLLFPTEWKNTKCSYHESPCLFPIYGKRKFMFQTTNQVWLI
jgi:hypothetical protein